MLCPLVLRCIINKFSMNIYSSVCKGGHSNELVLKVDTIGVLLNRPLVEVYSRITVHYYVS